MDVKELRAQMLRKGISMDDLCGILKISRSALSKKFNGKSLFTQDEICKIRDALDLSDDQVLSIFFPRKVS